MNHSFPKGRSCGTKVKKSATIYISVLLMLAMLTLGFTGLQQPVEAIGNNPEISVFINGVAAAFDVPPQIQDGRTLVPLRGIFEHLQATVTWDEQKRSVTVVRAEDERTVVLTIGSALALLDGKQVQLDVPPAIREGRTMIPLRFIAEALDARVEWDAKEYQVRIHSLSQPGLPEKTSLPLTGSEIYQRYKDAVVQIRAYDRQGNEIVYGTGFNISPCGEIITAFHVVENAAAAFVNFDKTRFPVTGYRAADREQDIILLDIPGEGLPCIPLGDSDLITGGEPVVIIGYPLKLSKIFSEGSASPLADGLLNYILTTAPAAPGSSGSPLFNVNGQAVGVIIATFTEGQNFNLAVPINVLKTLTILPEPQPLLSLAQNPTVEASEKGNVQEDEEDKELFVLPYDVFADYLERHHGKITIDTHNQIRFFHVYVSEGESPQDLLVVFSLDKENYGSWLAALNDGQEQPLKAWVQEIFRVSEGIYPFKELTAGIMLQDCFIHYPAYVPDESIQYKDGCFFVKHYIGYFYHFQGERHIKW